MHIAADSKLSGRVLIKVEDIKAELSDASGAYEDFFRIAGERETDERLDVAAEHIKELIAAVRDGFKEANFSLNHVNYHGLKAVAWSNLIQELFWLEKPALSSLAC